MKISYILPVHNEQVTIGHTIKSLLAQKELKEIIVIDDASTDNTKTVLDYYYDQGLIKLIRTHKRLGAATCRNAGNSKASGDIIAVCDADFYYNDRGQAIEEYFDKNPENGVFYSGVDVEFSQDFRERYKQNAYKWDFNSKCSISHPTVAYRREIAEQYPYHETSIETDLFEFMLLDMHRGGVKFGGTDSSLMLKFEKDTKRNKLKANKLKKKMYKNYGIKV